MTHTFGSFLRLKEIRRKHLAAAAGAALMALTPVEPVTALVKRDGNADEIVDRMTVVDCLLPGRVRQLGRYARYSERRRPARLSAGECETRGGEYVAYDRAESGASFKVWMPLAMDGDANAQLIVGELAERGKDGAPDYDLAKLWYERAAGQGNAAAMFNLGRMYEQGLGVEANKASASEWYRKAYGLEKGDLGGAVEFGELQAEIETLRTTVSDLETELEKALSDKRALEAELRDREAALQSATQSIASVTQDLSAARQESAAAYDDYQSTLDLVKKEQAALEARRAEIAQAEADLNERARVLEENRDALSQKLASEIESVAELKERSAEIKKIRAELEAEKQRARDLQAEKAAALAAREQASSEVAALRASLEEKVTALAAREKTLADREAQLAAAQANRDASALQTDTALREKQEAIADEQAALSIQREKIAADLAALNAGRKTQEQREEELRQTEARVEEQLAALAAREKALAQSEQSLASKARELSAVDKEKLAALEKVQADRQALAQKRADLEAERTKLSADRDGLAAKRQEIAAAETALSEKAAALESRTRALGEREEAVETREKELAKLEAEASEAKEKLQALETIIASNQRAIKTTDANAVKISDIGKSKRMDIEFGTYHAILIGNANYEDPNWPDLDTPHNDVKRVDEILRTRYGFQTTVLLDAKRDEILAAIEDAGARLGEKDNLLIYYAGHGKYSDDAKTGFWEPVDSITYAYRNSIPAQQINFFLSTIKVKKVLVVSDSCYSGAFARNMVEQLDPSVEAKQREKFYMIQAAKKSRVVMTAGGLKPVADGIGNGHSLFASAFINALTDNDDVTLARNLFGRIRKVVVDSALAVNLDQEPVFADMVHSGHEGGDFIFVPAEGAG